MWRIGELARRSGVSERTLRFYDRTGLLRPAHVSPGSGYRWYGGDELVRLERIRALADLGVPLKDIADLLDAPSGQDRQAVARAAAHLRRQAAAVQAVLERAEEYLALDSPFVGREVPVGARRFRVRRLLVRDPALLGDHCDTAGGAILTWLSGAEPDGAGQAGFPAAVTVPDEPGAEVEVLGVPGPPGGPPGARQSGRSGGRRPEPAGARS
jgi:DNA-binding transcriptional MerR regulator